MASQFARFDASAWPLVTVIFEGAPTDDEFDACLAQFDVIFQRGARVAFVIDASDGAAISATQRRRAAEWIGARSRAIRDQCAGVAFVVTSQVVRGVITAIFWVQPLPAPWTMEVRRTSAFAWARDKVREPRADRAEERISEI
jgi:hypothetical protein